MVFEFNPIAHRGDRLTDDEFYDFCQANPSLHIEREADGQIVFQMPTNTKTGLKNADLIIDVGIWNRKTKLGVIADSSAGFTLPDTSIRAPDVSWISHDRWDALSEKEQDKFAQICPDFVIELMSDSSEQYTLPAKMEKYLRNGVRLGWAIDPFEQQTTIYRPDVAPETVSFTTELSGETALPGLTLLLSNLLQ
ncbi:MAG: Uma2 family endonuclease [Spirosoma sp.]|nr:Uma2 family endonuclease [Spirosoma sp.]